MSVRSWPARSGRPRGHGRNRSPVGPRATGSCADRHRTGCGRPARHASAWWARYAGRQDSGSRPYFYSRRVLLTLTTTHAPATDLGFLLMKHPDRVQSFTVTGGQAHVFYPEATAERCTVALLLDIDP